MCIKPQRPCWTCWTTQLKQPKIAIPLYSKELLDALSEATHRLTLIETAVVNFDQVRLSLMMKYDDGYTLTTNRLRDLEAETKT